MKRDLISLSNQRFDVLVVGAGIHGVLCAWDAVLRGLRVALIERDDFGGATSQNSLKTIHGGLRYLKDGNFKRIRSMAVERRTWMKIAPHLVHPLSCVTPTYHELVQGRYAMSAALSLNDLLSFDRNRLPDPQKYLPGGHLISRQDFARIIPGADLTGVTGAAVWHDAQVYNTERLLLSFVLSAAHSGAVVANYVEAQELVHKDSKLTSVKAMDRLTGDVFEIQARLVINASGAWMDKVLHSLDKTSAWQNFIPSVAINLVVDQHWGGFAAGLRSRPELLPGNSVHPSQMFFFSPWRQYSLIGTWHLLWPHSPDEFTLSEAILHDFITQVNTAHPGLKLSLDDILHVHWGFLPALEKSLRANDVRLIREGQVLDHQQSYGVDGLISVLGVKYTTARRVAQQALDLAVKKLGMNVQPCRTHLEPIWGGKIDRFNDYLEKAVLNAPQALSPDIIQHLVYSYGSEYTQILSQMRDNPSLQMRIAESSPVTRAEVVHAVRSEMAQNLVDIIQRRTELGSAGLPSLEILRACAVLVAEELGWDERSIECSLEKVRMSYPLSAFRGIQHAYTS
jgi:glycerol-3-phosphate dehydrogenase